MGVHQVTSTTRYAYAGGADAAWGTLSQAGVLTQQYVSLPGGATKIIGASTRWSYSNLHGDTVLAADNTGTRAAGHSNYDPFGDPIDPRLKPSWQNTLRSRRRLCWRPGSWMRCWNHPLPGSS